MKSTSEIILDCVISKIKKGEISDISMSKIAGLAEIGKSTIYEYFDSKEMLIFEAISMMADDYVSRILNCSLDLDFKESFKEHLFVVLDIAGECSVFERIVRQGDAVYFKHNALDQLIEDKVNILINRMNEIGLKGVTEGIVVLKDDAKYIPMIITALIQGVVMQYAVGKLSLSKEEIFTALYSNILKVLNN